MQHCLSLAGCKHMLQHDISNIGRSTACIRAHCGGPRRLRYILHLCMGCHWLRMRDYANERTGAICLDSLLWILLRCGSEAHMILSTSRQPVTPPGKQGREWNCFYKRRLTNINATSSLLLRTEGSLRI